MSRFYSMQRLLLLSTATTRRKQPANITNTAVTAKTTRTTASSSFLLFPLLFPDGVIQQSNYQQHRHYCSYNSNLIYDYENNNNNMILIGTNNNNNNNMKTNYFSSKTNNNSFSKRAAQALGKNNNNARRNNNNKENVVVTGRATPHNNLSSDIINEEKKATNITIGVNSNNSDDDNNIDIYGDTTATTTTSDDDDTTDIDDEVYESKKLSSSAALADEIKEETSIEDRKEESRSSEEKPKIPKEQHHHLYQLHEFAPKIIVLGVGGAGGNAINNMIFKELKGVEFVALNTDAQHLSTIYTDNKIQLGSELTKGLGCGANPDAGRLAAEECKDEISEILDGAHMVFITAGMGGGTGTGASPVIAELCYNMGILTVGVVTTPFRFEGTHRKRLAVEGISRLQDVVDTIIVIPNQNLFQFASPDTTFVDAFKIADDVLYGGVKSITDLITSPGLINLDFADVQSVMHGMGYAMMGQGHVISDDVETRSIDAANDALTNPLLGVDYMDKISTAKGMLVNIAGGNDMTLYEVDKAAQLITEKINDDTANIIFGSSYDTSLNGSISVSIVATGIEE